MQGLPDFRQNTFTILSPLMIPEAQLFDAFSSEKLLTLPVTLPLRWQAVLKAVEFHGKFCCGAIEIEVVNADWMLAAKFESGEAPGTQSAPQLFFLVRLFASEAA